MGRTIPVTEMRCKLSPNCSNLLIYRFLLMVDVQIISALIFPTYINLESIDDYTHCKSTFFQQSVDPLVDP